MSYTIVEDSSMLFDDSSVAIIPLDSNFEPISKEGEVFTSIYRSSYQVCKHHFITDGNKRQCYLHSVTNDRYVMYLIQDKVKMDYRKEIISLLSRYLNQCKSISILSEKLPESHIAELSNLLPCNLKVYSTALAL